MTLLLSVLRISDDLNVIPPLVNNITHKCDVSEILHDVQKPVHIPSKAISTH